MRVDQGGVGAGHGHRRPGGKGCHVETVLRLTDHADDFLHLVHVGGEDGGNVLCDRRVGGRQGRDADRLRPIVDEAIGGGADGAAVHRAGDAEVAETLAIAAGMDDGGVVDAQRFAEHGMAVAAEDDVDALGLPGDDLIVGDAEVADEDQQVDLTAVAGDDAPGDGEVVEIHDQLGVFGIDGAVVLAVIAAVGTGGKAEKADGQFADTARHEISRSWRGVVPSRQFRVGAEHRCPPVIAEAPQFLEAPGEVVVAEGAHVIAQGVDDLTGSRAMAELFGQRALFVVVATVGEQGEGIDASCRLQIAAHPGHRAAAGAIGIVGGMHVGDVYEVEPLDPVLIRLTGEGLPQGQAGRYPGRRQDKGRGETLPEEMSSPWRAQMIHGNLHCWGLAGDYLARAPAPSFAPPWGVNVSLRSVIGNKSINCALRCRLWRRALRSLNNSPPIPHGFLILTG